MIPLDVAILGASGYGGGELLRILAGHPDVAGMRGTSRQYAGRPFADCHPNLRGLVEGRFDADFDWATFGAGRQPVVFSALPHGELAERLPALERAWSASPLADRLVLIDLSGDFRLADPGTYRAAYGSAHPSPEHLGRFVYGLPEWTRASLGHARRIAAAGCFATALQLALLPLKGLDLGFIAASGVTGSSGSGAAPGATTHHPTRAHDFRAYKPLQHQHLPEVEATLRRGGIGASLAFVPQSAPLVRGIFACLQFALPAGLDATTLARRTEETCAGEPFLRLVDGSPRVAAVAGSNFCDIASAASDRHGVVMVALDNLVKGMAGQAVQCMNLALGISETTGLRTAGVYPG